MTEPHPVSTLLQIAGGYSLPRCLHVVANLGVADALEETPRTAAELAAAVGAHPDALGRVLRLFSAHGVFEHHGFGAFEDSVRTGRPAADTVLPSGLWAHFAEHPEEGGIFNAAMAGKAHGQVAAVVAAYDFSGFRAIGDIGGGRGHRLQAVLDRAPSARGVLFDQPHVIKETAGVASDRLTLQAGDFFKDALPACDAYLVMEIIHDWDDAESIAILKAIRRATPPGARLLLIEQMVPGDPGPHWSKTLDIHMLTLIGGRQRTQQEYAALLAEAGFTFKRQIDTPADISILEAV